MSSESNNGTGVLEQISACVQSGKADVSTDIPRGSAGQPGVAEYVDQAIAAGMSANAILEGGLMVGMGIIGKKFAANDVFIPEVLIAARAMHAGMAKLKPLFDQEDAPSRGTFVIGTVQGDLHDIGKNLVAMLLEGAGWTLVDLGVDCKPEKYIDAIAQHPGCVVGLSALLTTTMVTMRSTVAAIKEKHPETLVLIGGAPVTAAFAEEIGADAYAPDPSAAVDVLDRIKPAA